MSELNLTIYCRLSIPGADSVDTELCRLVLNPSQLINIFSERQPSLEKIENEKSVLLTTEEMADYLQKSSSTIRNWKRVGLIPFQRIGRSIFFNKGDVLAAIKKINFTENTRSLKISK